MKENERKKAMKKMELRKLVGGALQEQFAKSFEKVVENLQNPNTPFKNSREINIKLKFTQNEKRDDVKCGILVAEKLAPQSPMETAFSVGKDLKTGELFAVEYGKQCNGQVTMDDLNREENPVVDTETGEIIGKPIDNVIDLRNAALK